MSEKQPEENRADAPAKPRRAKRPRKAPVEAVAGDEASALPAFVTGSE